MRKKTWMIKSCSVAPINPTEVACKWVKCERYSIEKWAVIIAGANETIFQALPLSLSIAQTETIEQISDTWSRL